jgi:hypothetical protein
MNAQDPKTAPPKKPKGLMTFQVVAENAAPAQKGIPTVVAPNNIRETQRLKDLNLKVPWEDYKRIRNVSTNHYMTMKETLLQAFEEWVERHVEAPAGGPEKFK